MSSKQTELPASPGMGKGPGWYQVGPNPNDQAHWDGEEWTARRRWAGARWLDLPLVEVTEEEQPEKRRGLRLRGRAGRASARGNGKVPHLAAGDGASVGVASPTAEEADSELDVSHDTPPEVAEGEDAGVGRGAPAATEAAPSEAAPSEAVPSEAASSEPARPKPSAPRAGSRSARTRKGPRQAGPRKVAKGEAAAQQVAPYELLRPGIARQRHVQDDVDLGAPPLELIPLEEIPQELIPQEQVPLQEVSQVEAPLLDVAVEEIEPEVAADETVAIDRRARLLRTFAILATAGSMGVWLFAVQGIHASGIGAYGFFNALNAGFFVAAALLVLAFASTLAFPRPPRWLLLLQVAALLTILYGTVVIAEPLPRFATTWVHAGFTNFIATHGRTLPNYDARFNWPGFFATAAMLSKAAGLQNPIDLLKWAPVFFNAVYAIGVYAVASSVTKNERSRWLAVWLFLSFNWVGQDYFAPQGFAALLAICCVVIMLRWFRTPVPAPAGERFPRLTALLGRAPDEVPALDASRNRRFLLLGLLVVLFTAVVVSHQLTPPVIVLWAAALVLGMRTRLTTLPLVLGTIFLVWLSFGTVAYWSGHLKDIFGGAFQLGSTLNQNLTSRVTGSTSRVTVQHLTIAFTAFIYLLAGVGFLRRLRSGFGEGTIALLAVTPFSIIVLQAYGGEALLRTVFLGLPFLAVLGAMAFFPKPAVPTIAKTLCLAAVLIGAVPLFMLARYGDESWEYQSPAELAAYQYVYDHAPQGSVLVSVANEVFWGYRDVGKIKLQGNTTLTDLAVAQKELSARAPAAFLIVTKSQVAYGRYSAGLPADWARKLENALLATGHYRTVFSNAGGQVLARTQGSHVS